MALNINQLTSVGEFQREYLYQLIVLKEPIAPSFAANKPAGFNINSVDLFTEDGDVPEASQTVKKLEWAGQYTNRAMNLNPSNTASFKFRMPQDFTLWDYFYAWHQLSGDRKTAAQVPFALYTGVLGVRFFQTDKSTYVKTVELHNAFFPKCDKRSVKKGGAEFMIVSFDIAYDWTEENNSKGNA
jgi:hypothetical protein